MQFDLLLKSGTVVTETESRQADVGIKDGKIVAIDSTLDGEATEVIDVSGRLVLPGGIDSHVHISQPSGDGIAMADDFESGTRSALFGGNTTIMPFCLQERDGDLRSAINWYHGLAENQLYTDVAFHLIVANPSPGVLGQELPAAIKDGYTSIKVFMTYENLRLNDAELLATFDVAREHGATMMIHCENEDAIRFLVERHEANGDIRPRAHASTRPIPVEREATHRALSLAEIVDLPIVIVHVSNAAATEEIRRARARGMKVTAETCPQYLVLTEDDLDGMDWEGAKFVCSPPPRNTEEQAACWEGLTDGTFDLFSSDHCPFRYEGTDGKMNPKGAKNFRYIPNGIPGVETRLPILFSEGVGKGRINLQQFVALTATNHAKTYGLFPRKGTIAVGSDADIAIWDPDLTRTVTHDGLHDGADYSPYEGMTLTGWPTTVVLRGKVMVRDDVLEGELGDGQYLSR
ncbi:dihydropyrimidinase [Marinibacterium profundimaris]|uniref:D-hydantoinase n=1 Tax=Marinibacterium profundimaris TaxID=1679460 RepID=A0A225NFD3_9RHOB|nr:dihydropyrimidinase [Marinibacterium profundimaris]OWU71477.1 dihydropyrimidinase [Marinibacterium profundimaris]